MAFDRSYVAQNARQRERLRALVTRLSDAELERPLDAGWTIAGVLGHLAFWDQRILVLLESWERAGVSAVPGPLDHADVDWINDAAKPMLLALPARRAADLALAIADAVDGKAEKLADEVVTRNAEAGNPVNLLRATHRAEHLDQIERSLGR
jgi:uncharacterized damage-inducible protein DinB